MYNNQSLYSSYCPIYYNSNFNSNNLSSYNLNYNQSPIYFNNPNCTFKQEYSPDSNSYYPYQVQQVNPVSSPQDQLGQSKKRKFADESDHDEFSPKQVKLKEDIKCEICGDNSSGFHYGAHTCEACKLFFSRVTKNKRKRKLDECPLKNCVVNISNRSDCGECRFKKCVEIGMSITRSRFGRGASSSSTQTKSSPPTPVTAKTQSHYNSKMINLLSETKSKIEFTIGTLNHENVNQSEVYFRKLITEFYENVTSLFENDSTQTQTVKYKFLTNHLLKPSLILLNTDESTSKLNTLIVFFCMLFEIEYKYRLNLIQYSTQVKPKHLECFEFLEPNLIYLINQINISIQGLDQFPKQLVKICSFVYVMLNLFQIDQINFSPENSRLNKSIADLIKTQLLVCLPDQNNNSTTGFASALDQSHVNLQAFGYASSSVYSMNNSSEFFHFLSQFVVVLNSAFF